MGKKLKWELFSLTRWIKLELCPEFINSVMSVAKGFNKECLKWSRAPLLMFQKRILPEKLEATQSKLTLPISFLSALVLSTAWKKIVSRRKNEKYLGFGMQTNSSQGRRAAAQSALNEGHGSDDEQDQRERDRYLSDVEAFDLIEFGMIPEFVGRFPALVPFHALDSDMLVQILTMPKNALVPQYQMLFGMDKVELNFTPGALKLIAKSAIKKKTGARGLRAIMEKLLLDCMYETPESDITVVEINEDVMLGKCPPIYHRSEPEADDANSDLDSDNQQAAVGE